MIVLRLLGGLLILLAVIAAVSDATKTQSAKSGIVVTSMARQWAEIAPQSLSAAQTTVQRSLHPALWDPVLLKLLQAPTWAALGLTGIALCYLGRRRRRVNVYSN